MSDVTGGLSMCLTLQEVYPYVFDVTGGLSLCLSHYRRFIPVSLMLQL